MLQLCCPASFPAATAAVALGCRAPGTVCARRFGQFGEDPLPLLPVPCRESRLVLVASAARAEPAGMDASTAPSPLVAVCGFAFVQSPSSECATTRLQSENEHFGVNEDLCAIGGADGDFAPAIGCAKPSASVCGDVWTPSLDRLLNIRSDRLTTHNSVSVRCTQTELSQAPWFVRWLR